MPFPYQPHQSSTPYGLHIPYNQGYDARSRATAPTAEDRGASAYLRRPNGAQVDLWVTDITADFSVSGQSGQSRMLREFFPHSFNDVTLQITGNVASTQEYNRLALFIREHHWRALQYINQGGTATQTMTFGLYDNTPSSWAGTSRTTDVVVQGEPPSGHQTNVKGAHRPWVVNGYVKTMAAGAVRHEVAPEFSLAFVVCESTLNGNTGIWGDSLASGSQLKSMLQLLNLANSGARVQGAGFTKDPISAPTPSSASSTKGATAVAQGIAAGINEALGWSVAAVVGSIL